MFNRVVVFGLLCFLVVGFDACKKKEKDDDETDDPAGGDDGTGTEVEDGSPVPGTAIEISDVTPHGFNLSWGEATDPNDKAFTYKIVFALSADEIDTIAEADAVTGDAVLEDIASTVTSASATDLDLVTDYAVTIVATNSDGLRSLYAPVETTTLPMRMFVTATTMNASFADAAAVDAYCNSDSNKPSDDSTFKAAIAGAAWRKACLSPNCVSGTAGRVDWVFAANTPYGRTDGTMIGTTDANSLLPDPILAAPEPGNSNPIWGGFDSTWQSSGNNCTAWTASGSTADGMVPSPFYLDAVHWLSGGSPSCNNTGALLCVEQ